MKNKQFDGKVPEHGVGNTAYQDSTAKMIFGDPILCSQFLRDYIPLEVMEDIRPEDIEDVTERFVHMFVEERESDIIKRVRIRNDDVPFYLVSLIEHKASVDYNVTMQILRYMIFIWEDYEKEQERIHKGISKTKDFRYPPILPIIYYTGKNTWTATTEVVDRISLSDIFKDYIPNFKCILIQLREYSHAQLMEKQDELSLMLMINKLKNIGDFNQWKAEVDNEYLVDIARQTPDYLLYMIAHMVEVLLHKLNVPKEAIDDVSKTIVEKKMAGLFDDFEVVDIQALRSEILAEYEREKQKYLAEHEREKQKYLAEQEQHLAEHKQQREDAFRMYSDLYHLGRQEEVYCKMLQEFPERREEIESMK